MISNKVSLRPLFTSIYQMAKQSYPSAERNKEPILQVLKRHVLDEEGKVLEVSSGTGQHLAFFARHFPKLTFQPSEFDKSLFESIKAYAEDTETGNMKEPIFIDITSDCQSWGIDKFDYMINVNMIHISPFACTEGLFRNASKVLKPTGLLFTYGPYAHNGVLEPQSNVDFDRSLRQRNPEWGVRDIRDLEELAKANEIELKHLYDLPSNNKCLVWERL